MLILELQVKSKQGATMERKQIEIKITVSIERCRVQVDETMTLSHSPSGLYWSNSNAQRFMWFDEFSCISDTTSEPIKCRLFNYLMQTTWHHNTLPFMQHTFRRSIKCCVIALYSHYYYYSDNQFNYYSIVRNRSLAWSLPLLQNGSLFSELKLRNFLICWFCSRDANDAVVKVTPFFTWMANSPSPMSIFIGI